MDGSDLVARDLEVLWHPCSQMRDQHEFPPLPVVAAQGVWLELADGRRLLDATSSWWCAALGHRHPRLVAALVGQLDCYAQVILANTAQEPVVRLCERLLAVANGLPATAWGPEAAVGRRPGFLSKVFLTDNGSSAVEVAVKMALQAQAQAGQPQRTVFAAFEGGYHGETVGALSVGDCGLYAAPYRRLLFPCTQLGPLPWRTGPQDPAWQDAGDVWPAWEAALAPLAGTLAAIVCEPVLQGAGGMRLYSPDLLRRLRTWADDHGVLLIADEIASGFGRLGRMLASQWAGVQADLVVMGKGLTGGMLPLSAVLVTEGIYRCFEADWSAGRAFLHSHTYAGNALAAAVANAVLDVFAAEDVLGQVGRRGPALLAGLTEAARTRPWLRRVRGCGMMAAVDLTTPAGTPLDPGRRTGRAVFRAAVARGALLRNLGDTIYLFPPLTSTETELEALLAITVGAMDAVLATVEQPPRLAPWAAPA